MEKAAVTIVPRSRLDHRTEGPTRGDAHARFVPHGAPGHLDFAPLVMCAVGEMYPGEVVKMHVHENVDNFLYVRTGSVLHRDDLGNEFIAKAGQAMLLAAGASAKHEERAHGDEAVEAVLFWLDPEERNGASSFHLYPGSSKSVEQGGWTTLGIREVHWGEESVPLRSDSAIRHRAFAPQTNGDYALGPGRRAYLVVLGGTVTVDGNQLTPGDRALIRGHFEHPTTLAIKAENSCEVFLVDLPQCCARS